MTGTRGPSGFYGARLTLPPRDEEAAVTAFWESGCLGVEVVSSARSRQRPRLTLRAYFPGLARRSSLEVRLAQALRRAGIATRRPVRVVRVADRHWVELWQRSLRPMRIGRRILIVPEGCDVPPVRGRLPIRVRFGQAFGTGEHVSTRMSLRLLEATLTPGDRVADLGTGTAILAMAARRLGAGSVLAVDDDDVALRVAADNLRDNHLDGITLIEGDAARALRRGPFDIALVNIGASVIGRLLPEIAAALAPRGRVILAGLLIDDEEPILARSASLSLALERRLRQRPWSGLLLKHGT